MKPINQTLRFSIQVILLTLLCFAMTPSAMAAEHYSGRTMADTSNQRADHQKSDPMKPLMVSDSAANDTDMTFENSESDSDKEADMQAKRQKMIEKCEANRGTDCESAVDTELEAQGLDIVHTAPSDLRYMPIRPRPRPRPR